MGAVPGAHNYRLPASGPVFSPCARACVCAVPGTHTAVCGAPRGMPVGVACYQNDSRAACRRPSPRASSNDLTSAFLFCCRALRLCLRTLRRGSFLAMPPQRERPRGPLHAHTHIYTILTMVDCKRVYWLERRSNRASIKVTSPHDRFTLHAQRQAPTPRDQQ